MKITFLTLFPQQIESHLEYGVFRIASQDHGIQLEVRNLRDWTDDTHKTVDDKPYGGGPGMVIKIEPVYRALRDLKAQNCKVIVTTPVGEVFSDKVARELADSFYQDDVHYIILCGHYEGFDARVHEHLVDLELSVGDYVLSGGELPALTISDAIIRLIPGVLGNYESADDDSFADGLLEYPSYTRPDDFNGWKVPDVLISGDHKKIEQWRRSESENLTKKNRPDLLPIED